MNKKIGGRKADPDGSWICGKLGLIKRHFPSMISIDIWEKSPFIDSIALSVPYGDNVHSCKGNSPNEFYRLLNPFKIPEQVQLVQNEEI